MKLFSFYREKMDLGPAMVIKIKVMILKLN